MTKNISILLAALATSLCLSAHAADSDKAMTNNTGAGADGISRAQAKDLKTQSEAQYKARGKVAEANEVMNKADCKTALDGAAKRACEASAKATAKGAKADAKMVHEAQETAIKDAKK